MHPILRQPRAAARIGVKAAVLAIAALAAAGCRSDAPDAYGSFEAHEVVVSAEVGGQLLRFDAAEGSRLAAGSVAALLDTTPVALQIAELRSQRSAGQAQTEHAGAQAGALEAQLRGAEREYARTRRLYDDQAATQQQLEHWRSQVEVLREQIRAARQQTAGSQEQTGATDARIAQLQDRLSRSRVHNPVPGTVLTAYARAGEFVQPGQPLYRIADLDTLVLRAYVTGDQLAQVRLGQPVRVRFDAAPGELGTLPGVVSWIASAAEFTPTPIQTRDERAALVYAVRVRVPNPDGVLKIGMPGELELASPDASPRPPDDR
jgi:HlyD family secretion protein